MPLPRTGWINVAAAVAGGGCAGFGIGRLLAGQAAAGAAALAVGLVLLWWAFDDRRKFDRDAPESEADGSHTVE
ncbi:MAG: hypothetical protein JWM27_4272 [Gemmatimonadetes bacterium]|nr:hypothetical protein [Gemmatimonadota bacterium]